SPSSHPSLLILPFFSHVPPTTEIYTLSLHDALPIFRVGDVRQDTRLAANGKRLRVGLAVGGGTHLIVSGRRDRTARARRPHDETDRKSTRLNSSHVEISYAVFCLKKKKKKTTQKIIA